MLTSVLKICGIIFLTLAAAALAVLLWGWIQGEKVRDLTTFEVTLVDRVVERVAHDLPRREAVKRLLVMPVGGDELDGQVTDRLVVKLGERDEYTVIDARRYKGVTIAPEDAKKALEVAEALRTDARPDGLLYSTVRRVVPRDGLGTEVELEARLFVLDKKEESTADKARRIAALLFPELAPDPMVKTAGEPVVAAEKITSRASLDWYAPFVQSQSRFARLSLWLLVAGGLPFACFPLVQTITRRENNALNGAVVAAFVAVDLVAALMLMGVRIGFGGWMLLAIGGIVAAAYTLVICDQIDEARK